jgi:citronellol/citronellal dehydrogenase
MLKNRVAIITGATRGIGRNIAMTLAKNGCNIVVAGKSIKDTGQLPGTIHSVSEEIREYGMSVLPYQIDVRNSESLNDLVNTTINHFGKIDILINNAGALWWKNMLETPVKKYDLVNEVNSRAAYTLSQLCLPHMLKNNWGHIIMQSPPFTPEYINNLITTEKIKYKTAYMTSKLGMSITALGIAQELRETGVAANTLWPMTPIESFALINNNLGTKKQWRKPEIISDAIMHILQEDPKTFTGNSLIDETYLKTKGITDFSKYQCVQGHEPPKLNDLRESFVYPPYLL